MQATVKWSELCQSDEYRGRWVALDHCRYDEATARPIEGTIVDADEDLVELCNRIRSNGGRECAILFIEERLSSPPASGPRAVH
jgi:hypothetical protein